MIITYEKHGRSSQDTTCLLRHLEKPENEFVRLLQIGNSLASDMPGVIRDMEILRDGSAARAALHHLSVNPARSFSDEELLTAANAVRLELDPRGERPYFIVAHGKPRLGGQDANVHAHLVLGHVDGKGRALKDGRSKIRTEVTARILEFHQRDVERPILGRHHKLVVKMLRGQGLDDVAAWLVATHGEDPDRPRSAMSSNSRQRANRAGINLSAAKVAITAAWTENHSIELFEAALARLRYSIVGGRKPGVWIIVDAQGNTLGAMDRLLRLKRGRVRELMENEYESGSHDKQAGPATADHRARQKAASEIGADQRTVGTVNAAVDAVGECSRVRGKQRSDRNDRAAFGDTVGARPPDWELFGRNRRQARSPVGQFQYQRALKQLRLAGSQVARNATCIRTIEEFERFGGPLLPRNWLVTDLWGVPIEPSKKFVP